jgi:hypothetical protein
MRAHRPRRDEQLLTDLTVGESLGRQLGDLQLLRRQLIAGFRHATAARLTGRAQLAAGLVAPRLAAERVEGVARGAQQVPRIGDPPPPSQPLTESELRAGALERPAREIGAERRPEPLLCLGVVGKQRAGVIQAERDPAAGALARLRLDLLHARSRLLDAVEMQRGLGQVPDQPGGDHGVIRRVRGIEEALRRGVRVGVPARSQGCHDPAELREGDGDVGARRHGDPFRPGGGLLGCQFIATHPGNERDHGVRAVGATHHRAALPRMTDSFEPHTVPYMSRHHNLTRVKVVGLSAVLFSALYLLSDVVEAVQGGFSDTQLWMTLAAEAAIPGFVVGLYLVQRPEIRWFGRVGALAYAYAFVFFTGTVVYALVNGIGDYNVLSADLASWMTLHGTIMVLAGLCFAYAVMTAGVLPRWTGMTFAAGGRCFAGPVRAFAAAGRRNTRCGLRRHGRRASGIRREVG